jgi:multiple sugar transport system substrate-binding protein
MVDYLKAPVGTWDGKTYRVTIDGDCHTFAYRTDYFGEGAGIGGAEVPEDLAKVNAITKIPGRQDRPADRPAAHGYLDPLKGWGGFGFYFLENRAAPM